MFQFTYSFCMAMLHSLWQAGLLVLLYLIVENLTHKNSAPLAKRNFLYIAISVQLVLFFCTFSIYFFNSEGFSSLSGTIQDIATSLGSENLKGITPWIFSLYILIITVKLFKAVHGWYYFKYQYKTGLLKPTIDLKLFTDLKAHQFGIRRKVKLWLSSSIQTPVTFGYFKPIILLPVALINNISEKQAETLILHELTHIRTNDYLLNWFLVIAETIFFFNPFITGLCKKVKLEREKHCDMNVISFEYSPTLYAETLLLAERMKRLTPVFQLGAVSRKKHLLQRIRFFTSEKVLNNRLHFNIVAPLIGLALLFMLSTAILFQSHKTAGQSQTFTGMPYISSDNYLNSNAEIATALFTVSNIQTEPKCDDKEMPVVKEPEENTVEATAVCEPQPATQNEVETEAASPLELNYSKQMAAAENDAARQIIITEEGSGGAVSVKVYHLRFEDGKWILQPELVLNGAKEMMVDHPTQKISTDSLQRKSRKNYPAQQ